MGATYTRQSSYTDGDVITAADTNNEFDQLLAAFAASTGHTHDGTTAEGGPITKLLGTSITIGDATAGTDITVTFDGESNDGVLKWMEDEDYFEFSDDILVASTEKIQFRDTAIYINSSADGQLDLVADTEIQIAATTVDINGAVDVSGNLSVGGNLDVTGTFDLSDSNFTNAGNIQLDSISGDSDTNTSITFSGSDVITVATGGTTSFTVDASQNILMSAAKKVQFRDTALTINSSTDGQMDIDADTELEITAPTVDINASTAVLVSNDLKLDSDAAVLGFGADNDVTLTHVADTGLLLNGTMALQFNDASQSINAPSATVLDINATDEIELNATLVDANANLDVSGTYTGGGLMTTGGNIVIPDSGNIGSASDTDAIAIASNGQVTLTQTLIGTALDISGDIDVDGTTNLDVVDIDGAVDMATTLAVAGNVDFNGDLDVDGTTNLDNTDIDGTLVVDGSNISLDSTSTLNIDNSNTSNGITIGTATSGVPVSIGHTTSETTVNDNLTVTGSTTLAATSFGDADITNVGDIALDSISADGTDINIAVTDNSATALTIKQGSDAYLIVDTANSSESVSIGTGISGTAITIGHGTSETTIGDNLVVTGNLTVNGTTTTVNSTTMTVDDPIITLGGDTAPGSDDNKDRGIEFRYHDGSSARIGFFGYDDSASAFTFLTAATNSSEVFSGTIGNVTGGVGTFASLDISGNIDVDGTTNLDVVDIDGAVDMASTLTVGGVVDITDTTDSSDATGDTGALRTEGGASIAKKLYVGTDLDVDGTANLDVVDIDGAVDMASTLTLAGNADFNGDLDVDGTTNLDVVDVDGAVNFAADVTFADGADIITASAGTSNFRAGVNAGNSIASGGNYNVAVGDEAGTALTTGDGNVAVGYQALATEDANGTNTAIGYQSLQTLNAGADSYNTAVGYQAGNDITTGIENVLIGGTAGDALTDGDKNVAVGTAALGSDTRGNFSTAIGHGALNSSNTTNDTDMYNTAVGYLAGTAVTTGVQNTIIGSLAGDALTDADSNVVMGYGALTTDTKGSLSVAIGASALATQNFTTATNTFNTAVGAVAGQNLTTGTRNTLVGGLSGDALTTGEYNTTLGYAALSGDTLGRRSVAIGYEALGSQNFTTATETYNTAVGYSAGNAVTTGISNTIVGGRAGDALTDADFNVAIGMDSLTTDTLGGKSTALGVGALGTQNFTTATDTFNTALGFQAGLSVTTGLRNVLVGGLAGDSGTTAANNVIVGYNSDLAAVDTAQVIVLGSGVTSQAANNFTFGFGATDSNIAFGATSITAPSDERYKEDIADSTAGLSFIKDLRPVTFKWKKEKDVPSDHKAYVADSNDRVMQSQGETNHGFIAQEVKAAIDNHSEIKDGFNMWSADPTDGRQRLGDAALMPIMVKAVQELSTALDAALARIATLEG